MKHEQVAEAIIAMGRRLDELAGLLSAALPHLQRANPMETPAESVAIEQLCDKVASALLAVSVEQAKGGGL